MFRLLYFGIPRWKDSTVAQEGFYGDCQWIWENSWAKIQTSSIHSCPQNFRSWELWGIPLTLEIPFSISQFVGLRLDKTQHCCPGSVEVDGKMPLAWAKSDLSLLSFSETELNPPPLYFFVFSFPKWVQSLVTLPTF